MSSPGMADKHAPLICTGDGSTATVFPTGPNTHRFKTNLHGRWAGRTDTSASSTVLLACVCGQLNTQNTAVVTPRMYVCAVGRRRIQTTPEQSAETCMLSRVCQVTCTRERMEWHAFSAPWLLLALHRHGMRIPSADVLIVSQLAAGHAAAGEPQCMRARAFMLPPAT